MNMKIHKPNGAIPWKRILKEHVIDIAIGIAIGLYIGIDLNFAQIAEGIKSLGGLTVITAAIVSVGTMIHRIYQKPKE